MAFVWFVALFFIYFIFLCITRIAYSAIFILFIVIAGYAWLIDILLGLKSEDSSYDARLFASANQLASARFLLHRGV